MNARLAAIAAAAITEALPATRPPSPVLGGVIMPEPPGTGVLVAVGAAAQLVVITVVPVTPPDVAETVMD